MSPACDTTQVAASLQSPKSDSGKLTESKDALLLQQSREQLKVGAVGQKRLELHVTMDKGDSTYHRKDDKLGTIYRRARGPVDQDKESTQ